MSEIPTNPYAIVEKLEQQLADVRQHYEELRSVVDDGSESMTHKDAVGEVKEMRQRVAELENHIEKIAIAFNCFAKTERPLQHTFDQLRNIINAAMEDK